MKKILFLLLCTVSMYGQALQNPTFGTVKLKTNLATASSSKIISQDSITGDLNYIDAVNLPIQTVVLDSLKNKVGYNTRVKVEYPDLFTFRPFTIYEKNSRYYTDFKVSSLVSDKISKMLPYYVNFVSGSNANDGKTPATAFKTISYAYGIGARLIYLSKGVHLSSWGSLNSSYTNTDDFFVIGASDGGSIVTNAPATLPTFSLVSGTAYSATVTSNTMAVDLKYTDSYGFPLKLKDVSTQAECIAELGTFYKNGNVITINLKDGRVPDIDVLITASTANADYKANAGYNYVKDITFIGGGFSLGSHGSESQTGSNSTMVSLNENCKFLYAQSSDYISNGGEGSRTRYNKLTMFENCVSYGNSRDGFNYVSDSGNPMSILEINCQAFNNGLKALSISVNGSSSHMPSNILRVNCKYYNNYGANIADAQGGTITYNVGVECFDSALPPENSLNNDFYIEPAALAVSYMYNRGCQSFGSTNSFKISGIYPSHMYNIDCKYNGAISTTTPLAPQTINFTSSFAKADVPAYIFPVLSAYTAAVGYLPMNNPIATGVLTTPAVVVSGETASTIASFDASKNLKSLPTATYPSLTELSYAKGVTSALQTQLNAKASLASPTFTGSPTAPTPTAGDNDTSIATTAFVTGAIATADAGNVKLTGDQTKAGLLSFDRSALNPNSGINITVSTGSGSPLASATSGSNIAASFTTTSTGSAVYAMATSSGDAIVSGVTGTGFNFVGKNNTTNTFTVNKTGDVVSNTVTLNSVLKLKAYTVGTLPAGTVGDMAYVTDALAPTYNATVVGGGAVRVLVFYNGTNWTAH